MLHPFISSPIPSAPRRTGGSVLALSALAHVGLVYAAVATTSALRPPHMAEAPTERVTFTELAFRTPRSSALRSSTARRHRVRRAAASSTFKLPQLFFADLALPDVPPLPEFQPDMPPMEIAGNADLADDAMRLGVGTGKSGGPALGPHDAYEEVAVEKRAMPVSANPKPRYPSRMLRRGIETNFEVFFVVDTTGTVDKETVELPPTVEQEFTRAVTEVLFNWRFVPAELGGRRVRQRVLQPFTFRLEGGARW